MDSTALWLEVAGDSVAAAQLLRETHVRSCLSRAYYAAYSACCAWFESEEDNPSVTLAVTAEGDVWYGHSELLDNIQRMGGYRRQCGENWPDDHIRDLRLQMQRLWKYRRTADYDPATWLGPQDVEDAVRDSAAVIERILLAVSPDGGGP